jgi:hypothetical protein
MTAAAAAIYITAVPGTHAIAYATNATFFPVGTIDAASVTDPGWWRV